MGSSLGILFNGCWRLRAVQTLRKEGWRYFRYLIWKEYLGDWSSRRTLLMMEGILKANVDFAFLVDATTAATVTQTLKYWRKQHGNR